jgi:hypothetical protein
VAAAVSRPISMKLAGVSGIEATSLATIGVKIKYVFLVLVWSITGFFRFLRIDDSHRRSRVRDAAALIAAGPLIWIGLLWCLLQEL